MKSIIYALIDNGTMKPRYVGKTTKSLAVRFKQHMQLCSPNVHLNNWLRTADVSAIVLERDPADLNEAEIRWAREMRKQGARLLNKNNGGAGGVAGWRHTPKACAKMSAAAKGNQNSLGYKHTAETRAKMSAAAMGKQNTPEARAKMSIAHIGKHISAETRAKISAALKGNQNSLGRVVSVATRAKMSAAAKGNQNSLGYKQ